MERLTDEQLAELAELQKKAADIRRRIAVLREKMRTEGEQHG